MLLIKVRMEIPMRIGVEMRSDAVDVVDCGVAVVVVDVDVRGDVFAGGDVVAGVPLTSKESSNRAIYSCNHANSEMRTARQNRESQSFGRDGSAIRTKRVFQSNINYAVLRLWINWYY